MIWNPFIGGQDPELTYLASLHDALQENLRN